MLAYEDEDEFVSWFPTTFPTAPSYFFRTRPINQAGPRLLRDVSRPGALAPRDFRDASRKALIVDVRPLPDYSEGHIFGALSNAFRGVYAVWLGWLVSRGTPLLFVTGETPIDQVVSDSLLVGHEGFAGWLDGGMASWAGAGLPLARNGLVDPHQARKYLLEGAVALDVRETREFQSGHLEAAVHIPLGNLEKDLAGLPKDRPILAYCGHGERSATGLSILERSGFQRLLNLNGGIGAWRDAGYNVA